MLQGKILRCKYDIHKTKCCMLSHCQHMLEGCVEHEKEVTDTDVREDRETESQKGKQNASRFRVARDILCRGVESSVSPSPGRGDDLRDPGIGELSD